MMENNPDSPASNHNPISNPSPTGDPNPASNPNHTSNPVSNAPKSNPLKRWLGLALIALSFIFYGGLFLAPFVPLSAGNKVVLSYLLVISGEASFWIGAVILGKEAISKYRRFGWRSIAARLFGISKSSHSKEEGKKED